MSAEFLTAEALGGAVEVYDRLTVRVSGMADDLQVAADAAPAVLALAGLDQRFISFTSSLPANPTSQQLAALPAGQLLSGAYRPAERQQRVQWNTSTHAWVEVGDGLASVSSVTTIRNRLTVDTLATLLAGIAGLVSGDTVIVQQALIGGTFAIRNTGTANGCTVYALPEGLFAIRLYAGPVLAAWAGMSPAASGTVNSDALQAAANLGGQVYVLPGVHAWGHKVTVGANTDIYGSGDATILRATTDVPFFETAPLAALPNDSEGHPVLAEGTKGVRLRRMSLERLVHPTATWEITLWDTINAVVEDVNVFSTDSLARTGLSGIACLATGHATCFMTRLTNIWCKSGSVVMQHSDSRLTGSNYIWANRREFGLKVETVNLSVAGTDFVPSWDMCAIWCTPNAVSMQVSDDCRFDGSYNAVLTGGAILIQGGSMHNLGGHFYQCGKWAIQLYQSRDCTIRPATYIDNNRINDPAQTTGEAGPGYGFADILLVDTFDSTVHVGSHAITGTRTHQDVAVREQGISDRNKIISGTATGAYDRAVIKIGPNTIVTDVTGPDGKLEYPKRTSGTVTMLAGQTFVVTGHGLGRTPDSVQITPRANVGAFWQGGIDAGNLTIQVATAVAADTVFNWAAS